MTPWLVCSLVLFAGEGATRVNELGPVKVTTTLAPAQPTIGDEITLDIQVEAEAGVEVLMPEFGESLQRYTILNFVPRQQIDDRGRSAFTQRYTLQPAMSGAQYIPPILVEFVDHRPGQKPAPDDFDAYEILTDRIDFEVASVVPQGAARELMPPLGALSLLGTGSRGLLWGGVLLGLAAIAAAAGLVVLLRRRRRRARRRNAYEVARRRLDQLLARPWPPDGAAIEAFFVSISYIVRRYLEDRFELRAPELTTEEFLALAGTSPDLTDEHRSLLRDFLRQADLVKFAGAQAGEAEIRLSSDLAARFLEETRENAPLIEDPEAVAHGSGGPLDVAPRVPAVAATEELHA
jgi:hypothetical protein